MELTEAINISMHGRIVSGDAELHVFALRDSDSSERGNVMVRVMHPDGRIEESAASSPREMYALIGVFFSKYGEWQA